jgi:hypothetical protein
VLQVLSHSLNGIFSHGSAAFVGNRAYFKIKGASHRVSIMSCDHLTRASLLRRSYGGSGANGECFYEVCPTPDNGTYVQKAPMPAEDVPAPDAAADGSFTNVLTVHLNAEGAHGFPKSIESS